MNPKVMWLIVATLTATVVITLVGCSDGDAAARQELVDFARQMVAEQQAASRSLQSQSAQLSTAARELVASDAAARAELISAGSRLHQGIAQQRQELDRARDELVSEQRAIASQRHRDPVIAAAIANVGFAAIGVLPLAVCWLVIRAAQHAPVTDETTQILLLELAGETDRFGDRPRRIDSPSAPALSGHPTMKLMEKNLDANNSPTDS